MIDKAVRAVDYLKHILQAIGRVERYTADMSEHNRSRSRESGIALQQAFSLNIKVYFYIIGLYDKVDYMSRSSATERLPPASLDALAKLGADLAVARLRRRESLASWAKRMGVTVPTLMNMEAGEPSVSIGIYLTALYLIGKDLTVGDLAAPEHDTGAIELDVREAMELGRTRARDARIAAETRKQRQQASHEK